MGSQAWNSVPRMTWQVHAPKNDTVRYFIPDKNSDGESKGFTFSIVSDEPKTTGYLVIEDDGIDHTADSIIAQKSTQGESKFDQCCQWLLESIPSEGKNKDDVIEEGKAQKFGTKLIYAAFKSLNGESEKQFSGKAKWTIPNHGSATATIGEFANHGTPTATIGKSLENKDETALFDAENSFRSSTHVTLPRLGESVDSTPIGLTEFDQYCVSCRRMERPCQQYVPSPAGCENHFAMMRLKSWRVPPNANSSKESMKSTMPTMIMLSRFSQDMAWKWTMTSF